MPTCESLVRGKATTGASTATTSPLLIFLPATKYLPRLSSNLIM